MAVSSTPLGTLLLTDNVNGSDGDCNHSPVRIPAVFGVSAASVAFGDVNGDGWQDVVAAAPSVGNGVTVMLNNGSNVFVNSSTSGVGPVTQVTVFDANVDGAVDVLTLSSSSPSGNALLIGGGEGTLSAASAMSSMLRSVGTVASASVFDCTGDGWVDMVVLDGGGGITLLVNSGDGSVSYVDSGVGRGLSVSAMSFSVSGSTVQSFAAGDIDGDGDVDVVTFGSAVNNSGVLVYNHGVFVNNGSGFFTFVVGASRGLDGFGDVTAASFGDANNDGMVDLFVFQVSGSRLYLNSGTGAFTLSTMWPSGGGASALVDVNSDGVLDAPGIGWLNPGGLAAGTVAVYVTAVDRAGGLTQYGATVCMRRVGDSGDVALCRVVDGGGVGGQSVYGVLFSGVRASDAYDVDVWFVNGHHHSQLTRGSLGGVMMSSTGPYPAPWRVRDVPAISWLSLSPSSGIVGIGGVVVVTVQAAWREAGLVLSPANCCLVNGVNVSQSFVNHGNGSYSVTYVVGATDMEVTKRAPSLMFALRDGVYHDAISDTATESWLAMSTRNWSIDSRAPSVTLLAAPGNNSVRPTGSERVVVSCGTVTDESMFGCQVWYSLNGGAAVAASVVNGTVNAIDTSFGDGVVVTLQLWAVDAAGNVGNRTTLVWRVDALLPMTLWPSWVYHDVNVTSSTVEEFVFACNR